MICLHKYKKIHILYIYVYIYILWEGVCFELTSSWPRARVRGGWELQDKSHLALIAGIRRIVPAGYCLCAGITLESHSHGIGHPILSKTYCMTLRKARKPPWQPKAIQSGPRAAKTHPRGRQGRTESKTIKRIYTHVPVKIRASS